MSNKKITLIALSWKKNPYLKRLVVSYSNYDYHLILADASEEPWTWPAIGSSGRLTWEYFNLSGGDNPVGSYVHRFIEAISRVKTEFVTLIDDEEILFPTGIEKSIKKLQDDKNASCAGGNVATLFSSDENEIKVGKWGRRSDPFYLSSQKSFDRINLVIEEERTANLTYQVIKTSLAKEFSNLLKESNFKYFASPEVFITLYLLKNGTWEMGNYPYWLRVTGPAHESLDRWDSGQGYMSSQEAQWIASNIYPKEEVDKDHLYKLIISKWGLPRVSLVKKANISMRINSLKTKSKSFLKNIPFVLFIYKKFFRKTIYVPNLINYFQQFAELTPESLSECLFFESILQKFPVGISSSDGSSLKFKL